MIVHVVDGTYELFRHFYGLRRFNKGKDPPFGAVIGVLQTLLQMIEQGATHVGVATDHVIESFRNELWADYKTAEGIEPEGVDRVPRLKIIWDRARFPLDGLALRLDVANQLARRVAGMVDPEAAVEAGLGPLASDDTRTAMRRAESRPQALTLLFMAPEFQRR